MIHYACDRCQRTIHPDEEPRYVVRIDVEAIGDGPDESRDADEAVDFLAELNEMLEQETLADLDDDTDSLDSLEDALSRGDDLDHVFSHSSNSHPSTSPFASADAVSTLPPSFDLCPQCYAQYLKNPLGRERSLKLHFSNN